MKHHDNGACRRNALAASKSSCHCFALLLGVWLSAAAVVWADSNGAPEKQRHNRTSQTPQTAAQSQGPTSGQKLFRGKVVMLREALARRKIESREEFDKQVVLESAEGELIPIVPDWRGRAFFQDEHLRNRDVELIGKRQTGVPYLQVLMIFTFDGQGTRQYTDYYCDTCGFPAYEIKPCECCQGPVHLRFQKRDLPAYIKAQQGPPKATEQRRSEADRASVREH